MEEEAAREEVELGAAVHGVVRSGGLIDVRSRHIDRTSKFAFVQLHEKATERIAAAFLHDLVAAVPYTIHTVLTDNGIQFTDNTPVDEEAEAKAAALLGRAR